MRAAFVLALQAGLLVDSSRRLALALVPMAGDALPWLVSVQVLAAAQVVTLGLALGYTGSLSSITLLAAHTLAWLAVRVATRRAGRSGASFRVSKTAMGSLTSWSPSERLGGIGLLLVLSVVLLTGVASEPLTHDALSYRLSRVAYWLQEGSIRHFPTNEPRQSYSPINADLVMLWLTHPFRVGFPLVSLAQGWGGILLLLSGWGIAQRCGLGRPARLASILLALGMPCVLVQFMTSQNDLFTAGLLSAAVYLALVDSGTAHLALPLWAAAALSLGAKGTVLYLAPALLLAGVVGLALRRPEPAALRRHALCAVMCFAALAAPRYVENVLAFGDPFAPREMYALNHGAAHPQALPHKALLNAFTYGVQALDPSSNAAALAPLLRPAFSALLPFLPERDPFAVADYPRRETVRLNSVSGEGQKNADTVSTGIVVPLLALAGAACALARWLARGSSAAALVAVGFGCAVAFLALFSTLFMWWPALFRYFTLVTVLLVVPAAFALEVLPARWAGPGWALAGTLSLALGAEVYLGTFNAGWRAVPPVRVDFAYWGDYLTQRALVSRLPGGARAGVALPFNTVLGGFFRQGHDVRVRFLPVDALQREGDAGRVLQATRLDALVTRPGYPPGDAQAVVFVSRQSSALVLFVRRPR